MAVFTSACQGDRTVTSVAERAVLTVTVQPAAALAPIAAALGWPARGVPGATVIAERVLTDGDGAATRDSAMSDAEGRARIAGLLPGRYALRVTRAFTAEERARGGATLGSAEGIAGVASAELAVSGGELAILVVTPAGGSSLVFTELNPTYPREPSGQPYYYNGFWEITNNTDTTVTLAGKLWMDVYAGYLESPLRPDGCRIFLPIERDPAAVYARWIYRFPPESRPLRPGDAIIIATDAIDHRAFGRAGFFDLSRADFEFAGTSDTDNPLVPNMLEVGPQTYGGTGHGYRYLGLRAAWAIADSLNIEVLPKWKDPVFGGVYTRVPANALLDIVRHRWEGSIEEFGSRYCTSAIAPSIDAADAVFLSVVDTLTIHRRVARTLPNGRVIFQRSRNSAADWIAGAGTPGRIP